MRQDVREMHQLYQHGLTLSEVGEQYHLSRERVRQLFNKEGLPTRSARETGAVKRKEREMWLRELAARFRVLGDAGAVASEAGTELAIVERAIRTYVPEAERPIKGRIVEKQYSDDELLECVRQAHDALGGVLSAASYERYRRGRSLSDGRRFPSQQVFRLRWGSWREGLVAAGLSANPSSPITGQHVFTAGHCIDAVREVWRSSGRLPSAREYDDHARAMAGAIPSLATLRLRCGSWTAALQEAVAMGAP